MGTRGTQLTLATRGSSVGRRQAAMVTERLAERRIGAEVVEADGDLFERVRAGDCDAAVHPLGDIDPADLVVAAVLERGSAGDALVTPDGTRLADLPAGATVGVSSPRRRAQVLAERPDLDVERLEGSVDERVERLLAPARKREYQRRLEAAGELDTPDDTDEETDREYDRTPEEWFDDLAEVERRALEREVDREYDAACLSMAALDWGGLRSSLAVEALDTGSFVPAPGQGIVAVTAPDGETAARIHDAIDHPPTRVVATVERAVLAELGGSHAPVGVHARLQGAVVTTTVRALSPDGTESVTGTRELPVERHAEAAREFAADLADRGARALVERAGATGR